MIVQSGSTDVTTYFVLRLAASGVEATGLTITDFDLQYTRSGVAPTAKVDATALAATDSAHADNKAIEIDATDQPGLYRVDWPDAAFAAGVREVILTVKCATCFTEHLRVSIVGYNPADGVRLGLTALPNAAADAAGGLIVSDAGGLDADAQLVTKINAILDDTGTAGVVVASLAANSITAAAIANGAIDAATFAADVGAEILSYIVDDATRIDASALNTATGTTIPAILDDTDLIDDGTSGLAKIATDVAAILVDTAEIGVAGDGLTNINLPNQTMDIVGNIVGNLSGSVGSVTGAVGSVTGAVGSVAAGGITAASIATDAIDADAIAASAVTEIQSGLSTLDAAGVRTAVGLGSANLDTQLGDLPTATENADALLKRDWSSVSGEAARSVLNALRKLRNEWSISGSTLTVKKEDDSTTAYTQSLTTSGSADPIVSIDN